jgi:hypothetical protein
MSEMHKLCSVLRDAKEAQMKIAGIYSEVLTAIQDYIEGVPKKAAEALKEEKIAMEDLVMEQRKQNNILNLIYNAHCGE